MSDMIRTRKQAFFAEDDVGYEWMIRAFTSLFHNIVDIVGVVHDTEDIVGIVHDIEDIVGIVKDIEDLWGTIGKGTI